MVGPRSRTTSMVGPRSRVTSMVGPVYRGRPVWWVLLVKDDQYGGSY